MNILILHQHYRTPQQGGAIRSYYLAQALVQSGHKVVVITGGQPGVYTDDGIEVHRLPVAYENRFSFYRRAVSFISFMLRAAWRAGRFSHFDACYAISVPLTVGLTARWLSIRYGLPYYFEVGDLWPDAPIELGYVKNPLLKKVLCSVERSIYQKSRGVIALSPAIAEAVKMRAPGKRVWIIPNMADCDFFKPGPKSPENESQFDTKDRFVITYAGAMGFANGLDFILRCAHQCQIENIPVRFILAGHGAMHEPLKTLSQQLKLKNLAILNFNDREGVKAMLSVSDAAFISYAPFRILETGSPNKFFDGLAAGKLIILNFSGWIWQEVDHAGCGFLATTPETFTQQLRTYIDSKEKLISAQMASRRLAEEKFSRVKLSEAFTRIFER